MVNNTINVEILDHVLAFLNGLESLSSSKLIWKSITLPDYESTWSLCRFANFKRKDLWRFSIIFLGILTLNS